MSSQKQKTIAIDLLPQEHELIMLIRTKYRFGKITVIVHDGIPKRIEETVSYQSLGE